MRSAPLALYWKAIEALDRQDASAIRLLKAAAAGLSSQDNPEEFKAVNYHLGRILEDEGDMESSGKYYIEILAVDYLYKDVLARMERIQGEEE